MFSIIFIFYFPKGTLCSYFSVVKISMIYIQILFCSFLPTLFICENISLSKGQSILHQCQTLPSLTGTFFHNMHVSVLNSNTEFFFSRPNTFIQRILAFLIICSENDSLHTVRRFYNSFWRPGWQKFYLSSMPHFLNVYSFPVFQSCSPLYNK